MRLKVCHQIAAWRVMRFLIRKFCRTPNLPHNSRKSQRATRHNCQLHCVCLCHLIVVCASFLPRLLLPLLLFCAMQLFPFSWPVLGFELPLKLSANFCNARFFVFFFPSCCSQPLFSTGHNQLEVVFCRFFC